MKEWFVYFRRFGDDADEDDRVVCFSSFRRLLCWVLLNLHDCYTITVRCLTEGRFTSRPDGGMS